LINGGVNHLPLNMERERLKERERAWRVMVEDKTKKN